MILEKLEIAGVDKRIIKELGDQGIEKLTKIQDLAIKKGIFNKKNLFICSPDSSGKSLLSHITALSTCLKEPKSKVIILYPLMSQANEIYSIFSKKYLKLGLNFARLNNIDINNASNLNIIIGTFKEMDELLLKKENWLSELVLIIIEEFNLFGEHEKGALLENLVIILMNYFDKSQFLFLSSNIGNAFDISDWLNLDLVETYTPNVPIKYSILERGTKDSIFYEIIKDTIRKKGQVLVISLNRSEAISICEKIIQNVSDLFEEKNIEKLNSFSKKIRDLGSNTFSTEKLNYFLKYGVAFHFTGMPTNEKLIVEDLFNQKIINIVSTTTEIGSGINMPARTIIFYKVTNSFPEKLDDKIDYDESISPNIIHQIFGRVGNLKYDKEGYGIILVENEIMKKIFEKKYFKKNIKGELLPKYGFIKSRIPNSNYLDYLILYNIRLEEDMTLSQLRNYFEKTLWYYQKINENDFSLRPILPKSLREIINEKSDSKTIFNVQKISNEHIMKLEIKEDKITGTIKSSNSDRDYKVVIDKDIEPNCNCEYWQFKLKKLNKYCKHIIKLINFIEKEDSYKDIRPVLLKNLNSENLLTTLFFKNFLIIDNDKISLTEKGKLCLYTNISPSLIDDLIINLKNEKIVYTDKFFDAIKKIIVNSLIELPYSSKSCIEALSFLSGNSDFYPVNFEPGDFIKLIKGLNGVFQSLVLIIKFNQLYDLEDKLLLFKSDIEKHINN